MGEILLMIMFALCIGGPVGAWIGTFRKRVHTGFVLGFLLGPLGWLITVGLDDERRKCPECQVAIPDRATRCRHCGIELRMDKPLAARPSLDSIAPHPIPMPTPRDVPEPPCDTVSDYKIWKRTKGIE